MFKAFVDEDIRGRFCILIRNENDVDKLLDYLKYNNIKCVRQRITDIDKSFIMDGFELCRINHSPNFYLYFHYNEFAKNFSVSYGVKFYSEEDARNCYTVNDIIGGREMFTKEDLKDGMVVKTREGKHYLVCGDKFIGDTGWLDPKDFDNSLECEIGSFTIDTVYDKIYWLESVCNEACLKPLWERKEPKEMTVAEIEKELGYSIKIVKGDDE